MARACWQCVRCMHDHPGLVMGADDDRCFTKTCQMPRRITGLDLNSSRSRKTTSILTYKDNQGQEAVCKDTQWELVIPVVKVKRQPALDEQIAIPKMQPDEKSFNEDQLLLLSKDADKPDAASVEAVLAAEANDEEPLPPYNPGAPLARPAGVGKQPRSMHDRLVRMHKAARMFAGSNPSSDYASGELQWHHACSCGHARSPTDPHRPLDQIRSPSRSSSAIPRRPTE